MLGLHGHVRSLAPRPGEADLDMVGAEFAAGAPAMLRKRLSGPNAWALLGGEVAKAAHQDLKQIALVTGDFLGHCLQRGGSLRDQARNQFHKLLFRSAISWILLLKR